MNVRAITKSFQAQMNANTVAATRAGVIDGRMTRTSAPIRDAPSTIAASSISSGMDRK